MAGFVDTGETVAEFDLSRFVGRARMDGLGERLVNSSQKNEDLGVVVYEVLRCEPIHRGAFSYWVNNGPRQWKKGHRFSFQFQEVKTADDMSTLRNEASE